MQKPFKRVYKKVGRNDACPCQSGKKYKNCCLTKIQKKLWEQENYNR